MSLRRRSLDAANRFLAKLDFVVTRTESPAQLWPELSTRDIQTLNDSLPFTMTSPSRLAALIVACNYVNRAQISGDFVECGVWKGGSVIAAARTLGMDPHFTGNFWLYDTFSGMTAPTVVDGAEANSRYDQSLRLAEGVDWCFASETEVKRNIELHSNLPLDRFRLVKGPVESTLRNSDTRPEAIAVLRLDTDWYESTLVELETLYPLLQPGGVLIIDDYGQWQGARRAVEEYFRNHGSLCLWPIDATGRFAIKTS